MNKKPPDYDVDSQFAPQVQELFAIVRELRSVVVAFSGGVDSAVMLKAALDVLGGERVVAVTSRSPAVPQRDLRSAAAVAERIGARHAWLDTLEFEDERYLSNPSDRCYFCKTELYSQLAPLAKQYGMEWVVNGANADDLGDYRPGMQAAREHTVRSPLLEAGISKEGVRALARAQGLDLHARPASPCLSSRIPYGEPITVEKLGRIDAAEDFLRGLGFAECRVRHHERLARIELPVGALERLADEALRTTIDEKLRALGFAYVSIDLRGFRSGSLNDVLLGRGLGGGRDAT